MGSVPAVSSSFVYPAAPAAAPIIHEVAYVGPTRMLGAIFIRNLLLTLTTLGVYQFWAKTRLRRFVWDATTVDGEPFEYTGTGKELFIGFLKAMAILFPLLGGVRLAQFLLGEDQEDIESAIQLVQTAVLVVLIYAGSYAARRYRMSRTAWRGIRFQQAGSAWRFTGHAALGLLLIAVTFGFYFPYFQTRLLRYETRHLRFGSVPFEFSGKGGELFGRFAVCWLLGILLFVVILVALVLAAMAAFGPGFFVPPAEQTEEMSRRFLYIGIAGLVGAYLAMGIAFLAVGPWYQSKFLRFRAAHTSCGGLRFAMPTATTGRLLRLHAGNWLMTILSLGFLAPFAMHRTTRFWCRHLQISGDLDLAQVAQAERRPGTGEGLAGFLNVDVG